ncbi:hypothetical protein CPB84DRAFT_1791503 [Gymnopilus junonius]|uniref:Uncharacterized protein n=1 Tax=Gymnopilus junonius TaxID=109634 RepID=A0A9P5NEQ7_GYMJU|nr:hypothetical protein CPB84DRAFT_1791503 [Gymnopilus junonius]
MMPLFLKGFRLDFDKICEVLEVDDADRYVRNIIYCIPREAYNRIGCGYGRNRKLILMIVMEDGYDPEELMKTPVDSSSDPTLADIAREVCTPGVWPCYDDIDNLETFWDNWDGPKIGEMTA